MRFILVSGKRASGKDHLSRHLQRALEAQGLRVHRTSLGSVNKRAYAALTGVDATRLEQDRAFKELHRLALVRHHQERNREDPEWALRSVVTQGLAAHADVLLVSDVRTLHDLTWFVAHAALPPVLLRVEASAGARLRRGWTPDAVKDALPTETGLDAFPAWSAVFDNSDDGDLALDAWCARIARTFTPRPGPPPAGARL